jgi:hypothetical protein
MEIQILVSFRRQDHSFQAQQEFAFNAAGTVTRLTSVGLPCGRDENKKQQLNRWRAGDPSLVLLIGICFLTLCGSAPSSTPLTSSVSFRSRPDIS